MSLIPCPVGLLDHSDVKLPQHEFDCFCKVCVLFRNVWFCQKMISIHQTKPLPNNLYNATTEFMKQTPTVKQVRKSCIDTLKQKRDGQSIDARLRQSLFLLHRSRFAKVSALQVNAERSSCIVGILHTGHGLWSFDCTA